MNKRWNILKAEDSEITALQSSLGINSTICKILVQRGIRTFDEARSFFRPLLSQLHDPFLMKDMDKAIARIQEAFRQKEKILVFGDYDVDGTTSVASMFQFLSSIYNDVDFYIPHRYKEGYGVSKAGIDYAFERNITLIISLDCGIKSVDLVAYAKSIGIDFIICDHHLPEKELPNAVAILNPKQVDCPYPFKELCGCGVGFKLMQALTKTFGLSDEAYLQYLDLVATAIAADIVPIVGENRVLAYYGLKKVNENPSTGIAALMKLAAAQKPMLITNLVFIIAPRVNAAGRMDDARKAVQLFIEKDPEKALEFAEMLHSDNTDRKEADANITEEALNIINADIKLISRKTTVVYQEHWHKGVVGIVASRLIDKGFYRPTVVLTKSGEIVAGSARSVAGFNLYEAVHACREHLLGYGGHFAAAGMTMAPENVEAFSSKFEEVVSSMIDDNLLIPEIVIDAEAGLNELTLNFYNIVSQMEPFGPENMRPVFVARNVFDTGYSKLVKEKHIRFDVKQNNSRLTGIGFDMADKLPIIQSGKSFDIVFTAELNEWNGDRTIQMRVIDVRETL
ncbi:single-stranded-DNA-specific exonuclease RecJ [Danxiaibacter flavus]|uniref:Single-stranded-DNA-specific exonuclease RecJ n=1 Tax=Danxiaibacter flavus TaxID=3049108 RepID=A0ABV3ZA97_9BACT|nr:single-stranded-DNA-specific exonuclease RecJ [Chitinophagaceae bacterium DXS]